jgi:hypothetical protein
LPNYTEGPVFPIYFNNKIQNKMKKFITTLFILSIFCRINGQNQDSLTIIAANIVKEATQLYKSEQASWYGTDYFLEKCKDKVPNSAGYFSYSEKDIDRCIFFSKDEKPKVLAAIDFKGEYAVDKAVCDTTERDLTPFELSLFRIRKETLRQIEKDTFVSHYKGSNLNIIPIIDGKSKKVYVITGSEKGGVVLIGNDYLFTFDENNRFVKRQKLHNSLLRFEYSKEQPAFGVMHTHLKELGEYISVTDLCTLMLYQKRAGWQVHYVMSEHFVSLWNCEANTLSIITIEAFEKMSKGGGKKKKKKGKE